MFHVHAVTGDRSQRSRKWMAPATRVGYDFCHAIVDDHSRLTYVELHPDDKAATVTAFMERSLVKNRALRELLASEEVKRLCGGSRKTSSDIWPSAKT